MTASFFDEIEPLLTWLRHAFGHFSDFTHLQAVGAIFLLCGFIIASTKLQQKTIIRSRDVLESISENIKQTALYKSAVLYIDRRQSPTASGLSFSDMASAIPVYFLVLIVFFCSVVAFFGAEFFQNSDLQSFVPSYVLGGIKAANPKSTVEDLLRFESETVFMGSMAFLGAYVWLIGNLISRINNYDTSPITFYFLSVRILTACLMAGIARQILPIIPRQVLDGGGNEPVLLAALGFLIGWNPTLWVAELVQWGAAIWRSGIPRQRWPAPQSMPQNMTIGMVQGLVDDKATRLMELDIDNCQKLACENAILIWLRTPYNLELIVDWIAQAQLCVLYEPDKIQTLRQNGIRDVFAYQEAIGGAEGLSAVQNLLQTPKGIIEGHRKAVATNPVFERLEELRRALRVVKFERPTIVSSTVQEDTSSPPSAA